MDTNSEISSSHQLLNNDELSDFEIVCNSDSDVENNGYKKFTNSSDFSGSSASTTITTTATLESSNFHQLKIDDDKLSCIMRKGKIEKINLSLSQEQIVLTTSNNSINSAVGGSSCGTGGDGIDDDSANGGQTILKENSNDNVYSTRLYSSEFLPKFYINSIQNSSLDKTNSSGKNTSSNDSTPTKTIVQNSNLPEIVLTSYEKEKKSGDGKAFKKTNRSNTSPTVLIDSSHLKIAAEGSGLRSGLGIHQHYHHNQHREQNSPSPELYLDRKLSPPSSNSSSFRRISELDGNGYSDGAYSTTATTITPGKPLNLGVDKTTLPYQMSVNLNHPRLGGTSRGLISQSGSNQFVLLSAKVEIPIDLRCRMCNQLYRDPRTLNCLHSFCFQCIVNENFGKDESIPFWSRPDGGNGFEWKERHYNSSTKSSSGDSENQVPPRPDSRSSMASSLKSKKSKHKSNKSSPKHSNSNHHHQATERARILVCSLCQFCTEMPIGGIQQLPQNLILVRKVESLLLKHGTDIITNAWCTLCCMEVPATYHCITCIINLCGFCKEAHERQKTTTGHNVKNILELQRHRNSAKKFFEESKLSLTCSLHPGFDLKSFCNTCQQIICVDCTVLLHKGHKIESAHKAFKIYQKLLKDSTDKSKPICEYVEHSIMKLGGISKKINKKCDEVQNEVENFMAAYFEAVEVHRKTLIQQITRARETKMQIILEQQMEMERKSLQTKEAIVFTEELFEMGSEIEVLSFVSTLLKRFEYCQKFKPLLDAKISDTLHFLPDCRAPSTKAQNNIPLYGIITTQTVEPQFCTLETEGWYLLSDRKHKNENRKIKISGYTQLRVHKRVELVMLSRDADGAPLCHGGLSLSVQVKYKDSSSKLIETQVSDRRDGTYVISFIPIYTGTLLMSITINNRHIKGSPFTLLARNVRPHTGIFHCCTFCSSKGSKIATCACEGVMPGFKGCGHGHNGHPGRRHWSCCGNVLENSECSTANRF